MTRLSLAAITVFMAFTSACASELGERVIEVELGHEGDSTDIGPTTATGLAVIDTVSGQVDITVQGLPMLDGEEYEGWLAGGGESAVSTAKFNTDENGDGSSSIIFGDISTRTYERVVLTVEPIPDPSPDPDPRHSIGGDIP